MQVTLTIPLQKINEQESTLEAQVQRLLVVLAATKEEDLASHRDDVVIEDETMSANESEVESSEAELGKIKTENLTSVY